MKKNLRNIVVDAAENDEINLVATELAVGMDERYKGDSQKTDPRDMDAYGMTIQGEKGILGEFETLILLSWSSKKNAYVMDSIKDRERVRAKGVTVHPIEQGGFLMDYIETTNIDIIHAD